MVVAAAVAFIATVTLVALMARRKAAERLAEARAEAKAVKTGGQMEATAARRKAETQAREEVLELRARAEEELARSAEKLGQGEEQLAKRTIAASAEARDLELRSQALDERFSEVKSLRDRAQGLKRDAADRREQARALLEERAGVSAEDVIAGLASRWREEAQAEAAQRLRAIEQGLSDTAFETRARRIMEIAIYRYTNHFLTERSISRLPVDGAVAELLAADEGRLREAIEEVSNVQLQMSDEDGHVRLEGLDGVGREVARRALDRLTKRPAAREEASADPKEWASAIRDNLDREIRGLGTRAFKILKVKKAHPDIVALVGALNYRTSYTQNQWRHAMEASFLCGMMADEMGLDSKLARRATLIHDIGKALTHQIEGSHAVIGAQMARDLGEDEVVANAIGSHHGDEAAKSPYASLVGAADAMSGARPGARREFAEGYSSRLHDLERIGGRHRGVDRAFAVHGGRELRVYVRDGDVSDEQAAELAAQIAEQISEELTFPGQIKVTAIRAFEAVSTAN